MNPLMSSVSRSAVAIAFMTFFGAACEPSGPEIPVDEFPADPDLPAAVVDLPSPPPASAFEIREMNDDGSLRVEGLISNRDQYLEEEIQIRGVITEIEGDCNPRQARQLGQSCLEPHFFIRDHHDDDRRLMVVGYPQNFLRQANLREGTDYLFEGTYQQMAHGFVSTEDGLLVLSAANDRQVGN